MEQVRLRQVGALEIGSGEVGFLEAAVGEVAALQANAGEVGEVEVAVVERRRRPHHLPPERPVEARAAEPRAEQAAVDEAR